MVTSATMEISSVNESPLTTEEDLVNQVDEIGLSSIIDPLSCRSDILLPTPFGGVSADTHVLKEIVVSTLSQVQGHTREPVCVAAEERRLVAVTSDPWGISNY